MHQHPNNFLSGVYYVRTHRGADTINFHDPRNQTGIIRPPVVELTAENTDHVVVRVKDGTMLVFPAYLQHSVDASASDQERISISFNIMFSFVHGASEQAAVAAGGSAHTRQRIVCQFVTFTRCDTPQYREPRTEQIPDLTGQDSDDESRRRHAVDEHAGLTPTGAASPWFDEHPSREIPINIRRPLTAAMGRSADAARGAR